MSRILCKTQLKLIYWTLYALDTRNQCQVTETFTHELSIEQFFYFHNE